MSKITSFLFASVLTLSSFLPLPGQEGKAPKTGGEYAAQVAPSGNFLVTLETGAEKLRINVEIHDGVVKSVKSSDPELEGMKGDFRRLVAKGVPMSDAGVYLLRMRNAKRTISQMWILRKDGSAAVREVPDRGEMQIAVPVTGDTIESVK